MDLTLTLDYDTYKANQKGIDEILDYLGCPLDGYPFREIKLTLPIDKAAMRLHKLERSMGMVKKRCRLD